MASIPCGLFLCNNSPKLIHPPKHPHISTEGGRVYRFAGKALTAHPAGNRIMVQDPTGTTYFSYDATNRLTEEEKI